MAKKISRRKFLISSGAAVGAAGLLGGSGLVTACSSAESTSAKQVPLREKGSYYLPEMPDKAISGKALKAGLIGCGGRGTGAVDNLLEAADGITITALADVFEDRIKATRESIAKNHGQEVPLDKCFVGFDAYKQLIDSGVDMVIIATPPAFRPVHFQYATAKGVHSFLEKPVCVDAKGYRTIMATAKQAEAKGLSVVTGTQRHHERSYVAAFDLIKQGIIGEITGGNVYWNQGMLWYRERQQGWSDMEWMIRDWVNWKWLSGDHIVEQHVHNIDVFTWMTGQHPIKATAFGSRQRRVTGDQYDNFSVDFEFENGVHLHSMCRQIDGCSSNISEHVQGTKGVWHNSGEIYDLKGNLIWKYDDDAAEKEFAQHNPYVLEHVDWVNHIRKGTTHVEAGETGMSSLAGIMGREAAYTGATIEWDQMSAADQDLMPAVLELGKMDMSQYTVPVPGSGK